MNSSRRNPIILKGLKILVDNRLPSAMFVAEKVQGNRDNKMSYFLKNYLKLRLSDW